jgi:hypothetical protein
MGPASPWRTCGSAFRPHLIQEDVMRPKPTILLGHIDKNYIVTEVMAAVGVFVLAYDGLPVGVRRRNDLLDFPGPKYRRTAFTNAGHAYNAAERMNKLFKTDKFSVLHYPVVGEPGVPLSEADYYRDYDVDKPPSFKP